MLSIFLILLTEPDQSTVGTVTSLQVQEGRGEVVRVTWVGMQGATSYRVSWRRTDGVWFFSSFVSSDIKVLKKLVSLRSLTLAVFCCRW